VQRKPHAGGRCASLAAVGNWQAAQRGNRFTVNVYDQALHGADYHRVCFTKQGFNPATRDWARATSKG
jgi:chitin-binding protein